MLRRARGKQKAALARGDRLAGPFVRCIQGGRGAGRPLRLRAWGAFVCSCNAHVYLCDAVHVKQRVCNVQAESMGAPQASLVKRCVWLER